jgi:hypothetical protein
VALHRACISREETAAGRAPGDHTEPLLHADGQDFPLDVALDERVLRLQADEPLVAVRPARVQASHELPAREVRDADVAHLAASYQVGKGGEGLLQGCRGIPTMHLVEI